MTENQINYILEHHKKYLSMFFCITEQAVFKWWQRGKMPIKYRDTLKIIDVDFFFDDIKTKSIAIIENKIDIIKNAIIE